MSPLKYLVRSIQKLPDQILPVPAHVVILLPAAAETHLALANLRGARAADGRDLVAREHSAAAAVFRQVIGRVQPPPGHGVLLLLLASWRRTTETLPSITHNFRIETVFVTAMKLF